MITWSESAIRRAGMTPDSVAAVLALTAEPDDAQERWQQALAKATDEVVTGAAQRIHFTAASIDRYAEMARAAGYVR